MKQYFPLRKDAPDHEIVAYIVRDMVVFPMSGYSYIKELDHVLGEAGYSTRRYRIHPAVSLAEAETNVLLCDLPFFLVVRKGDGIALELIPLSGTRYE
jgi:hypothetical protein